VGGEVLVLSTESEIQELQEVADPGLRAQRANELVTSYTAAVTEVSRIRREAIEELIAQGQTHAVIAKRLGVSRVRVTQVLQSGPQPERAFLGTGAVTVAIGGKLESGRTDSNSQPLVSTETLAAYEVLAEAAQSLKLEIHHEVVPPPGLVDLNRPNLIVLTSPKLLPFVGQVLASDKRFGFAADDQGWYLVDRQSETEHRAPESDGPERSRDFGYIGRLPRPDGAGNFLYLAGTHSLGTLGAARYVVDNLADLYREVKTKRFSMLVDVVYSVENRTIESVIPLTPLYRHEGVQ
jgi:hypothetical protein